MDASSEIVTVQLLEAYCLPFLLYVSESVSLCAINITSGGSNEGRGGAWPPSPRGHGGGRLLLSREGVPPGPRGEGGIDLLCMHIVIICK